MCDAMTGYFADIASGRRTVCEHGHALILGWSEATPRLVCQIAHVRADHAARARRELCSPARPRRGCAETRARAACAAPSRRVPSSCSPTRRPNPRWTRRSRTHSPSIASTHGRRAPESTCSRASATRRRCMSSCVSARRARPRSSSRCARSTMRKRTRATAPCSTARRSARCSRCGTCCSPAAARGSHRGCASSSR